MNKNIIKACLNPGSNIENDIKREVVKEIIDKYLEKEEVVFNDKVISLYDLDNILKEKMSNIKEMCNYNNYTLKSDIINKAYGFVFSSENLDFNIVDNGMLSIKLVHTILFSKVISFKCYLENNEIFYKISHCNLNSNSEIEQILMYIKYKKTYDFEQQNIAKKFIESFIKDNRIILLNLLSFIENNYKGISHISQYVYEDNLLMFFNFDLYSRTYTLNTYFKNNEETYNIEELGLLDYINDVRENLLKRISINIENLNPSYQSFIEEYYYSINSTNYKYLKK